MNRRDALLCYVLVAAMLVGALVAKAADSLSGSWTIQHSDEARKVQFALIRNDRRGNSTQESDWPLSIFVGLDLSQPGKRDVHFTITRDAGRFDCEGYVKDGEGAGIFHFFAEPKYAAEMKAMGFEVADTDKQFSLAVMDVTTAFAKQMQSE